MKIKIEIKSWLNGSVLFEYECEDNTIAKTLNAAVKCSANLRYADLRYADLRSADLRYANLRYADLRYADLRYADLRYANLSSADLRSANLSYANLSSADLRYAKNAEWTQAMTYITPEGSIIGWKKCKDDLIVKLRIPEEAKRSNATGRKCRAEYADVLEIIDPSDKRKKPTEAISQHDGKTTYKVGERVVCDKWNENRWNECSGGIHFFITQLEAENYI